MPMTAASKSIANLPWRSVEALAAARAAITRHHPIELQLPAELHHAVYAHFRPNATAVAAERLYVSGGAELLQQLARIEGLDALAQLAADVDAAHALVRVLSPAPTVVISFGATVTPT